MFPRHVTGMLRDSLGDSPVTALVGARQSGKSTLAQMLIGGRNDARYLTLDDAAVLAAAAGDPREFVRQLGGLVVLDEVQRVPELFPAIKLEVDRDRRPGQYLLTGSAHVLLLPKISESLAGRMEIHTLWPLSQGEINQTRERFVDGLFGNAQPQPAPQGESRVALIDRLLAGGFPPSVQRPSAARREAWFRGYVTSVLERDVRDLANIERLAELPRVLTALAARATGLLNVADLARSLGVPQTSLQRYLALLEHVFLIARVPAWHGNVGRRLLKSPKLLLSDTGLMGHLLGLSSNRLLDDSNRFGPVLENFVGMELVKQLSWRPDPIDLLHFRTAKGSEVDFVLEDRMGRIAGVEVKAAGAVASDDFKGLRLLAASVGDRFVRGAVLYTGEASISFGERLDAVPVQAMWS